MHGSKNDPGIIPNCMRFLLNAKPDRQLQILCSILEIYNVTISDLLCDKNKATENVIKVLLQKTNTGSSVERVANVTESDIQSMEQFENMLALARTRRKVAATQRNSDSSRSHAIVQLKLHGSYQSKQFESTLILVDLAGAENANDHLQEDGNEMRLKELANINTSMLEFGLVLEGLKKQQTGVNFRGSKLTYLLKPCLTTNTKTLIITSASPELKHFAASKSSLRLTSTTSKIKIENTKRNFLN